MGTTDLHFHHSDCWNNYSRLLAFITFLLILFTARQALGNRASTMRLARSTSIFASMEGFQII